MFAVISIVRLLGIFIGLTRFPRFFKISLLHLVACRVSRKYAGTSLGMFCDLFFCECLMCKTTREIPG